MARVDRPSDLLSPKLTEELLRLHRLNPGWVQFERLERNTCQATCVESTWLRKYCSRGADIFGMWGTSYWLGLGPKTARPSIRQCAALEHVSVNLELSDYSQPYPALLVELDCAPFHAVLCHHVPYLRFLTAQLFSVGHEHDIVTIVAVDGRPIEDSLTHFDDDCSEYSAAARKALRITINLCLAMVHFGEYSTYLLPKEVANDRRLTAERSERGERARQRLQLAMSLVSFAREPELCKGERGLRLGPVGVGSEKGCHWRRGHWVMQPCGPKRSERRRIFRTPVFVRADKFIGDTADTSTTYQ